jgi:hypothetical protein
MKRTSPFRIFKVSLFTSHPFPPAHLLFTPRSHQPIHTHYDKSPERERKKKKEDGTNEERRREGEREREREARRESMIPNPTLMLLLLLLFAMLPKDGRNTTT